MKLNENNIGEMANTFVATFLSACFQSKKIPFMDICLGFVLASVRIMTALETLGFMTEEQHKKIFTIFEETARKEQGSEEIQSLIKVIKALGGDTDVESE